MTGNPVIIGIKGVSPDGTQELVITEELLPDQIHALFHRYGTVQEIMNVLGFVMIAKVQAVLSEDAERFQQIQLPYNTQWHGFTLGSAGSN